MYLQCCSADVAHYKQTTKANQKMKFLMTIVSGIIVGSVGLYFTLDWQEEKIVYLLDQPAQFGDITYQSLRIRNAGWNPATNVLVILNHSSIKAENVKATSGLREYSGVEKAIGVIERIRRDEEIVLSFSFAGVPLASRDVEIKSDRSVASVIESSDWSFNWPTFFLGTGVCFVGFAFLGVFIQAYQDYKKRAERAAKAVNVQSSRMS